MGVTEPEMKKQTIISYRKDQRRIKVWGDPGLITKMRRYGCVIEPGGQPHVVLVVDKRYDFENVLGWLRATAKGPVEVIRETSDSDVIIFNTAVGIFLMLILLIALYAMISSYF